MPQNSRWELLQSELELVMYVKHTQRDEVGADLFKPYALATDIYTN